MSRTRTQRWASAVAASIAIAVAATGCSSSDRASSTVASSTVASSTVASTTSTSASAAAPAGTRAATAADATSPATTTTGDATAEAIEPKLVTAVPAAYVLQPDSVGDTGPSDLAKAAHDDGSADAVQVLTAAGFLGGYQRLWSTADGTSQIIVFVYQFRNAAGAQAYDAHGLAALRATEGLTVFDVAGVPGATGLTGTSQGTSAAIVDVAKGEWLFQIIGNVDGDEVPPSVVSDVQQLAADQYGRL